MGRANGINSQLATFTPTLLLGGANVGMTGNFLGSYLRTGPQIDMMIKIQLTALGSSTGDVSIGNLPFTASGVFLNKWLPCYLQFCTLSGVTYTQTVAELGSGFNKIVNIWQVDQSATAVLSLDNTNLSNNSIIIVSGSYWTDT